jgi:hypothetical protein
MFYYCAPGGGKTKMKRRNVKGQTGMGVRHGAKREMGDVSLCGFLKI